MFSRPKPGECEEDLLRLQDEFFKNKAENKIEPAAKLVKLVENVSVDQSSKYNPLEQLANTFEDIPKSARLGVIVEKSPSTDHPSMFATRSLQGFPKARRRDLNIKPISGSIFASQVKKIKKENLESTGSAIMFNLNIKENIEKVDASEVAQIDEKDKVKNLPKQSYILEGQDSDELHKENITKMEQMTEEEILQEQKMLLEAMDPAILTFLKSRRDRSKLPEKPPSMIEQIKAGDGIKLEDLDTPMEILTQPHSENWLHFESLETTKLAWMKNIDIPKVIKDKEYEARFNFEGHILPYKEDQISEKSRILYHHGEDPGRPGYTLQELFQLGRSTVIQQKIIALNTIANILSLDSMGLYECIIELPLEQIFFVLRFCMDDNTHSVLNAAIKAMRNLFFSYPDESCLDALMGFGIGLIQPGLSIDPKEYEDDPSVNDQQLAEKNLVKCLMRSNILGRLKYVINVVKPSIQTIVYSLEILTRLGRDSDYTVMQMYKFNGLIDSIIKKCIHQKYKQVSSNEMTSLPEAYKLLRIICTKNIGYCRDLINKHNIMESISACLSNIHVSTNKNGLLLQIQAVRLWTVFVGYNLAVEHFKILEPILVQLLNYHVYNTDLNMNTSYIIQTHVSAFITLISHGYSKGISYVFPAFILESGYLKWTSQLTSLDNFTCGKLQIISSLFMCYSNLIPYSIKNDVAMNMDKIFLCLDVMLHSKGFLKITENIQSASNILSRHKRRKSSPNLCTVESPIWEASDHIVPVLQTKSCMPFLCALSELLVVCGKSSLMITFLRHKNISNYIIKLKKCPNFSLMGNWFTQIESKFIMNILKLAVAVQKEIDLNFFYEFAVQCITIFTNEQKENLLFIMQNIIFNLNFFPCELLIENLTIKEEIDAVKNTLSKLNNILEVYGKVLGIKYLDTIAGTTNMCSNLPVKTVAPKDWIYSPIVFLYSQKQDNKQTLPELEQINYAQSSLQWIYLYEKYFKSLTDIIDPTDRFCRLACVFLSKDDLFFDENIHLLLEMVLKCIVTNYENKVNFNKPIEGLSNFEDFYKQLLEQYQGVSYGDTLFGNFVLVPLAQRQDVKWRKILWSEYAGVVQFLNVTRENLLIDMNTFLEPVETELSLLKCYRNALLTGLVRKNTVLYEIADHHVKKYIELKQLTKQSDNM